MSRRYRYLMLVCGVATFSLAACEGNPERDASDGTVVSTNDLGNGCSVWKIRERSTYDGFIFVTHCAHATDTAYDEARHVGKAVDGAPVHYRVEEGQ